MNFFGGHLLIASPYLADRNFFRSVVLIISHDQHHAFGLLLNRPSHDSLSQEWRDLTGESHHRKEMIRTGGPLDGPMMVLHQVTEHADTQVLKNVLLSSTEPSMRPLITNDHTPLVPFVGYSGWGPGQLEVELEVGGWMTVPATDEIVFADPNEQWNLASRQISDSILAGAEIRHVPQDPRWN